MTHTPRNVHFEETDTFSTCVSTDSALIAGTSTAGVDFPLLLGEVDPDTGDQTFGGKVFCALIAAFPAWGTVQAAHVLREGHQERRAERLDVAPIRERIP